MEEDKTLEKAAEEYFDSCDYYTDSVKYDVTEAFKNGADWREDNPVWHSIKDEEPPYEKDIILVDEYGDYDIARLGASDIYEIMHNNAGKVVAWMYLPKYKKNGTEN